MGTQAHPFVFIPPHKHLTKDFQKWNLHEQNLIVCKAKYTMHSHYRPHFKDTEHDNTTCKKTKTIRGLPHWIVSQVLHIPCISISKVTTTRTITEISDHWQNLQPKTQQYGSHYTSRERLTTYQAQIQAVDLCTCCSIQNLLFSWRRRTTTTRTKWKSYESLVI